jgi:peptidoglycan/xylan/chitin deacetylase (PgdA/CDA1 family)
VKYLIKKYIPRNLATLNLHKSEKKTILLTFDDGPDPKVTPLVLKKLKDYHARVVFFIPGRRISRAPWLMKTIIDEGHLIGNHTYDHLNGNQPGWLLYVKDIRRCQDIIALETGMRPKYFRPVGGKISLKTVIAPRLLGMKIIIFSNQAEDWRVRYSEDARRAAELIIKNIRNRDIILLHDDNPHILELLDILLPYLKEQQYDLYNGINLL